MIDFHTHILPGIDDGAKTEEDSLELLDNLIELGVDEIVLSPHYYPDQERIEDFIARRQASCEIFAKALGKREKTVPKLHLASEVYLDPIIFNNKDLSELTVDMGGKFIITELMYETEFSKTTRSMLKKLIYSHNLVPILAHIDRYPFLMKEKNLYSLLELGCIAQVNLSSMINFFQRKKLLKYFQKGYIGVIGSDTHNKNYINGFKNGLSYVCEEHINYVNSVSKGILKKVKKDSDDFDNHIIAD